MSSTRRTIQAPSVEIHEYDMSGYDRTNSSTNGTVCLVQGFADRGNDYETKWMNSMQNFVKEYGYPTNEAERYFYNLAYEIISNGGVLLTSKLPYYNKSKDKFSYTTYQVGDNAVPITSAEEVFSTIDDLNPEKDFFYRLFFDNDSIDVVDGKSLLDLIKISECPYQINAYLLKFLLENISFTYDELQYLNEAYTNGYDADDEDTGYRDFYYTLKSICDPSNLESVVDSAKRGCCEKLVEFSGTGLDYDDPEDVTKAIAGKFRKSKSTQFFLNIFNDVKSSICDELNPDLVDYYSGAKDWIEPLEVDTKLTVKYTELRQIDDNLTSFSNISSFDVREKDTDGKYANRGRSGLMDMETFDSLKTGELKLPRNRIAVVDITRTKYDRDTNIDVDDTHDNEYLGIVPIITTAYNALQYQGLIDVDYDFSNYNLVGSLQTVYTDLIDGKNNVVIDSSNFSTNLRSGERTATTVGTIATQYFPTITRNHYGNFDKQYLKQVGVVVFRAVRDTANDNKVKLTPVESFVGSLDRNAKDRTTSKNIFIDDIVNSQSRYINFFSNVPFGSESTSLTNVGKSSIFVIDNQHATSLGFFESDCEKDISVKESIIDPLDRIFDKINDPNSNPLDLVVDGGVSNIAQFIYSTRQNQVDTDKPMTRYGKFDFNTDKSALFQLKATDDQTAWRVVVEKYNDYCKNVRKDCMFIADGLRTFCLTGSQKIVRKSAPSNTISNSILPKVRFMTGINSSYGAGYCDWFMTDDKYTGDYFWCPPSVKATGRYLYTDTYYNYWDAPAGLRRGRLSDVIDVAFSPTIEEAGKIYTNQWNYAISYPLEGNVLEGQKTFQEEKTALDRVNVRRLMLGLERRVRFISKYFIYEGHTQVLRDRFRDQVTKILQEGVDNGGIREFYVKCDEENNTSETIDRNELHCTIAVKPIKTLEFLVCNFIATSQSMSVEEIAVNNV